MMMRQLAGWLVLIFVLAGLATGGRPAAADDAPVFKPLVFLPQWRPQAQFAGYYTALHQGFYRNHGLEVTILDGGPERSPTTYLAEHKTDIATMWLATALQIAGRGVPVVNLAQIVQRSALVLAVKRDSGINQPSDMNGKKMALWPADFQIQPRAFLDKYNLDVRIVTTASPVQLFLHDGVQITSLMWYNEYHTLRNSGLDSDEMRLFFFEGELNFPEDGIYLRADAYADDPRSARAFADASLEGWQYAFNHPEETVDLMIRVMEAAHVPANRVHQRWMLARMRDVIQPREVPFGMLRQNDFQRVCEVLTARGKIATAPSYGAFIGREKPHAAP